MNDFLLIYSSYRRALYFERQNLFNVLRNVRVLRSVLDDKLVGKKLFVVGSLVDLFLKTDRNQPLEWLGEFTWGQGWRLLGHDLFQLLEGRTPGCVRKFAGRHFDEADPQRPNVAPYVVIVDASSLRINSKMFQVSLRSR